jgi:hypothetical protein
MVGTVVLLPQFPGVQTLCLETLLFLTSRSVLTFSGMDRHGAAVSRFERAQILSAEGFRIRKAK